MAGYDEALLNGVIGLLGKSIEADAEIRLEQERQNGMTERLREELWAETERIKIHEQAQLLHHIIDVEADKFSQALSIDTQLKLKSIELLEKCLCNPSDINDSLRDICIKLIETVNNPGSNVKALEEKNKIYGNLLQLKSAH